MGNDTGLHGSSLRLVYSLGIGKNISTVRVQGLGLRITDQLIMI